MRLLTDTCAAMKLFALGDKLFKPGILKSGDLIIHPRVFNETKKWVPWKKEKYRAELKILAQIRSTPGLRPPDPKRVVTLQTIISATIDEIGTPIGAADRDQLISAIHSSAAIVTNDSTFAEVAEALDVAIYTAESIVIEAHAQNVVTKEEVRSARSKWSDNQEKRASVEDEGQLNTIMKSK